jgi:2',3'-cyclic-nucleotide 2'-phosphodiesterase (5'-nucleotidase family)
MSSKGKRVLSLLLSFSMAFGILIGIQSQALAVDLVTINILHTNDVHGRFYQVDGNNTAMIGIDRVAAVKAATTNAILVDVGDTIHGLPIVNINQGQNAIDMMTTAGYEVMTLGNHDFSYGSARLQTLAGLASAGGLGIISANVYDNVAGDYFLPQTKIVTVDGVKVGFFGLTTQTTPEVTNPLNVSTLTFRDYKQSAQLAIDALQAANADVIICMAHFDHADILAMLDALDPGYKIDVVLEGHEHLLGANNYNGVLINGSGEHQQNIGHVTITFDRDGGVATTATGTHIAKAATTSLTPEPATFALAESIKASVQAQYAQVVASSELLLSSARGSYTASPYQYTAGVRNSEQPLGNLVADSMRVIGGTDIVITNGGGLRDDIRVGNITRGDLNSVLPFGNFLVVKEVTPAALKAILEHGLQSTPAATGGFPQVSGMTIGYDETRPVGDKVQVIYINGVQLNLTDNTTIYTLGTNDFTAAGGDGYTAIAALRTIAELGSVDSMLEEYVDTVLGGVIPASIGQTEGRIVASNNVDKTSLRSLAATSVALDQSNYTAASWAAFAPALAYATAVANNAAATDAMVASAYSALYTARDGLVLAANTNQGANPGSSTTSPTTGTNTPKTGDTGTLAAATTMTLLAAGAAIVAIEKKKRLQSAA